MAGEATREVTRNDIRYNRVKNELNRVKDELEPTTKNDLEVDWESYKDVDGNSLDDLILEVLQNNFDCGNTYGYKVADEIIGLLPSVTPQEPNTWSLDDARENFMHDVYNQLDFLPTNEEANRIIDIFDRVTSSIEQEPRKGHWVKEESIFGWDGYSYQCSECGRSIHLDTEMEDLEDYPYCHCGAKMQEVKE